MFLAFFIFFLSLLSTISFFFFFIIHQTCNDLICKIQYKRLKTLLYALVKQIKTLFDQCVIKWNAICSFLKIKLNFLDPFFLFYIILFSRVMISITRKIACIICLVFFFLLLFSFNWKSRKSINFIILLYSQYFFHFFFVISLSTIQHVRKTGGNRISLRYKLQVFTFSPSSCFILNNSIFFYSCYNVTQNAH